MRVAIANHRTRDDDLDLFLDTVLDLGAATVADLAPDGVTWRRLDILGTEAGGPFDTDGVVEFVAHYRSPAGSGRLHEVSRFVREGGRWYYVDGEHPA